MSSTIAGTITMTIGSIVEMSLHCPRCSRTDAAVGFDGALLCARGAHRGRPMPAERSDQ